MFRNAQRLGAALLVAGCSTASTTPSYDAAEVGQPIETTEGQILASRVVEIAGDSTGTGPVAGAIVGGILGPLGFLAGAGLGHLTEQRLHGGDGIEYLVATVDGRTMTVVQEREDAEQPPLPAGTPVLVQMGALTTRVVERTGARWSGMTGGAADWVNPDTLPLAPAAAPPQPRRS